MADPVFGELKSLAMWGGPGAQRARPSSPAQQGALAAPNPAGGGGASLFANLANLGMSVYDKVWGPGRAQDELLQAQRAQVMEDRAAAAEKRAMDAQQLEFERRVEAASGQKYSPELAQAYSTTREAMTGRQSDPRVRGYQKPQGEVGPLGGGIGPNDVGPNLVVRPYRDLPSIVGRETANLRTAGEQAVEQLPEGPARERTREHIARRPQVTLPSEVPKLHKGYSEAAISAGTEAEQAAKAEATRAGKAAMDQYRATGDERYLVEALSHDAAGPGKLLEMDIKSKEAMVQHFEKLQKAQDMLAEALKQGDAVRVARITHDINVMQYGLAGLQKNPNVRLYPTITTPGIFFGQKYQTADFVTTREKAQRYVTGQMDPARTQRQLGEQSPAQDLIDLASINLGINAPGGRFTPEQAKVMDRYIVQYPGAPREAIEEAQNFLRNATAQGPVAPPPAPGESGGPAAPGQAGRQATGEVIAPGYEAAPPQPKGIVEGLREAGQEAVKGIKKLLPAPPAKGPGYYDKFEKQGGVGSQPTSQSLIGPKPAGAAVPPTGQPPIVAPASPLTGPRALLDRAIQQVMPAARPGPVVRGISPQEQPRIQAAAQAGGVDAQLLTALRLAEMGGPGREFGVLSTPAPTYDDQARIAANSLKQSAERFQQPPPVGKGKSPVGPDGRATDEFIQFFSDRYAPTKGATNDPTGLNKNHARNMISIYRKLTGRTQG